MVPMFKKPVEQAEGLGGLLELLASPEKTKALLDQVKSETQAHRESLAKAEELLAQVLAKTRDAQAKEDDLAKREATMVAAAAAQRQALADLERRENELAEGKSAFEAQVREETRALADAQVKTRNEAQIMGLSQGNAQAALDKRAQELAKRENELAETQVKASALVEEYEKKLAVLRQAVA